MSRMKAIFLKEMMLNTSELRINNSDGTGITYVLYVGGLWGTERGEARTVSCINVRGRGFSGNMSVAGVKKKSK